MASSTLSNATGQQILDYILKGVQMPQMNSSLWVAMFTTSPNAQGTGGVEVSTSGTGYKRIEMPRLSGTWTGPGGSNQEYNNTNEIVFPIPTGNWGTIISLGLYDAETNGNLVFYSSVATAKSVQLGDGSPRILPGQLKITKAAC